MRAQKSATTMKPPVPPTSVRDFYAREVRFHREQQGLDRPGLARLLHVTPSFLAHVEAARRCVTGAIAGQLDEVLPSDGFFTRNLAAGLTPRLTDSATVGMLEAEATTVTRWSPLLVPAPLQTGAYAEAVAHARHPFTAPAPPPAPPAPPRSGPDPQYEVVLSEGVLLRRVGGAVVMAEQMRHVAALVRQRRITMRVLPFRAGAHGGMDGAFQLLAFADGGLVACAGGPDVGVLVENPPAVGSYVRVHQQVQDLALSPEESLELIETTATQHETQALTDRTPPAYVPRPRTAATHIPAPRMPDHTLPNGEENPMTPTPTAPTDTRTEVATALSDQNPDRDQGQGQELEQEGAPQWTITTVNGITVTGYLPGWAQEDPSQTGVRPERLSVALADLAHRRAFEGAAFTAFTTQGGPDETHHVGIFQAEIQCCPCPDPTLPGEPVIPVVNLQISPDCWMTGLGPDEVIDIAPQLRTLADRFDREVLPALIAARTDWKAQAETGKGTEAAE